MLWFISCLGFLILPLLVLCDSNDTTYSAVPNTNTLERTYNGLKVRRHSDKTIKINKIEVMGYIIEMVHDLYPPGILELNNKSISDVLSNVNHESALRTRNVPVVWTPTDCNTFGFRFIAIESIVDDSYTKVWLVKDSNTGTLYIWKRYKTFAHFTVETGFFMVADHDYIGRPICCIMESGKKRFPGIILEIVLGSSSTKYFSYFNGSALNDRLVRIGAQVYDALKYIHWIGYTHGDLKPENILIDSRGNAVVIDFGFSLPIPHYRRGQGTPLTIAPEVVGYIQAANIDNTDWFSFGQTLAQWALSTQKDEKGRSWSAMKLWTSHFELRDFPVEYEKENRLREPFRQLLFYLMNPDPRQRQFNTQAQQRWLQSLPFWNVIDFELLAKRWK